MTYDPKEKFQWDEGDIVISKKKTKDLLLTLKQLLFYYQRLKLRKKIIKNERFP